MKKLILTTIFLLTCAGMAGAQQDLQSLGDITCVKIPKKCVAWAFGSTENRDVANWEIEWNKRHADKFVMDQAVHLANTEAVCNTVNLIKVACQEALK